MGAFRDPSTINNVGAVGSTTNPLTGSALGMDRENQKAIKELIGTLDWESLSILDGGITPVSSEIIVDTEGRTPADDLTTINLTSDGTTTLHTGMRIKIKSADPSRVITVKHLTGGGNIRTADGQDVVLSNDWSLDFKLQNGDWVEQKGGRGYKVAVDASVWASTALARTAPATTTSRGIGRVATAADSLPGATISNGPAFLDAGTFKITPTPTPNAVPRAGGNGKVDGWVSKATNTVAGVTRVSSAVNSTGEDASTQKGAYDTATSVTTSLLGAAFRQIQGGNAGPGGMVGKGSLGSSLSIGTSSPTNLPAGGTWWVFLLGSNPSGYVTLTSVRVYCVPGGTTVGTETTNYNGFAIRIA